MAKLSLSAQEVREMLVLICNRVIEAEPRLSEADRNLGDGDHGLGMQRGMTAALEKLQGPAALGIDQLFSTVGMAMMSSMGGASGAIFGSFFRSGGKALAGREGFDAPALALWVQAGLDGVKQRGGAAVGDKTVVDALEPAAIRAAAVQGESLPVAATAVAAAAWEGVEASKQMIAKFGRAKTLGEGCIGFPDAGAISASLMLQAVADFVNS
jgi:dihydroxyacetone kinase-like protein